MTTFTNRHKHIFRPIIELVALVVCVFIFIQEWSLIVSALQEIKESNVKLLLDASLLYWLVVPLTAVSYLLLSPLEISFKKLVLAVIAGSGPGRLVPGGFGLLSIVTLHLQKQGLSTRLALFISAANNLIGVMVGLIVLLLGSIINPQPLVRVLDNLPSLQVLVPTACFLSVVIVYLAIRYRIRIQKNPRREDKKSLMTFVMYVTGSPLRLIWLYLLALIILLSNVLILALVAKASQSPISLHESLVTLSIGVLIGSIIPTPGGVGGVEIGLVSALVLLGYDPKDATIIALGYRFITFFQPLLPGLLAYTYLRRVKEI